MKNCKVIATPVKKGLKLLPETSVKLLTKQPYTELVGSLMYLVTGTRPDLCFAVNK